MNNAREFVRKIKLLLEEIDEELISVIVRELKELQSKTKS